MVLLAIKPLNSGLGGRAQRTLFQKNQIKFIFLGRRFNPFRFLNFYNLFLLVVPSGVFKKYNFQIVGYFLAPYLLDSLLYSELARFSQFRFFVSVLLKFHLYLLLVILKLNALFFSLNYRWLP